MRSIAKLFMCMLLLGMGCGGLFTRAEIQERDTDLRSTQRADSADEKKLSRHIYFLDGSSRTLKRLDLAEAKIREVNVGIDLSSRFNNLRYATYTFPDSNGTGNRFLVLYYPDSKGFMIFDKITGTLDQTTFRFSNANDSEKCRTAKIYPVDYAEIGNCLNTLFFMKSRSPDGDTEKLECAYENNSGKVITYVLAPRVLEEYYNHHEKKLLWLEPSINGSFKTVIYDVTGQNTREFTIHLPGSNHPRVLMMAYGFIGIRFIKKQDQGTKRKNSQQIEHRVFEIGSNKPLLKFSRSSLFCHTVNNYNLYILVSDKIGAKNRLRFFHYNAEVTGANLQEKQVPQEVNRFLSTTWENVANIFYLSHGNTYYVCIIAKVDQEYRYKIFRLTGSFRHVEPDKKTQDMSMQALPAKYFKNSDVNFSAEEGILLLKDARGRTLAVGCVTDDGNLQLYPE